MGEETRHGFSVTFSFGHLGWKKQRSQREGERGEKEKKEMFIRGDDRDIDEWTASKQSFRCKGGWGGGENCVCI